MTPAEAARILREHNLWRRYNGDPFADDAPAAQDPRLIGEAIDVAIERLEGEQ